MAEQSTYIHGTEAEEQRRLSLMNDVLLNEPSIRELGLRGHERIVDFGAGLGQFARAMARAVPGGKVVAIERDPAQLAEGRRLAREAGEEQLVEWRAGDVLDLDFGAEWGTFDLAHARFLLEHVPDPLLVVQRMVRAVKRGGRIVLADDDHDVLRLWPEPPGVYRLWSAYMETYRAIGNDPFVGRKLVDLIRHAGAKPRRNTWIFFGGCAGMQYFDVLTANMLGVVLTARDRILSLGLIDETTFDDTVNRYREWARRNDAAIWFAMAWAEGQVE